MCARVKTDRTIDRRHNVVENNNRTRGTQTEKKPNKLPIVFFVAFSFDKSFVFSLAQHVFI